MRHHTLASTLSTVAATQWSRLPALTSEHPELITLRPSTARRVADGRLVEEVRVESLDHSELRALPRLAAGIVPVEAVDLRPLVVGDGEGTPRLLACRRHESVEHLGPLPVGDGHSAELSDLSGEVVGRGVDDLQGLTHVGDAIERAGRVLESHRGTRLTDASVQRVVAHRLIDASDRRSWTVRSRATSTPEGRQELDTLRSGDRLGHRDLHPRLRPPPQKTRRRNAEVGIENRGHVLEQPVAVVVDGVIVRRVLEHDVVLGIADRLVLSVDHDLVPLTIQQYVSRCRDSRVVDGHESGGWTRDGIEGEETALDVTDGNEARVMVGLVAL